MTKELTIAGGGLAGLSLGIALRRQGVAVTLLEAGSYPRHRVCGEFISGVSPETLNHLGITALFEDARLHTTICWYDGGRVIHRDHLPRPALGISRFVLDERLRESFEAEGGNLITGRRVKPHPAEGLVWTAGRRPKRGAWLGLKAHVRGLPLKADLQMHSGSNGYAGLAGVEDGWVNVCGLFRADPSLTANGRDLLPAYLRAGGNEALADLLESSEWREGSFSAVAGFDFGRQASVPGLLCIGDAESMIPPFTGNGMSMAFQAAETACGPLLAWSQGELSWEAAGNRIRDALRRRFRRRLAAAMGFHPMLFQSAGRSLIRSLSESGMLPFRPMLSFVR